MKIKHCSVCNQDKPISEFQVHNSSKDGYRYLCKDCKRKQSKKYRNPERTKTYDRLRSLKSYNLSEFDYYNLVEKQNGQCIICNQKTDLVIDHNHITKNVRGLLCSRCNVGLGLFKDNIQSLKNAIKYLQDNE